MREEKDNPNITQEKVMTPRVREILSWYGAENPGVLSNMAKMLNHGKMGGSGKMVILPVDQGFEHGPARSFSKNPDAYDPSYHFELAIEAGCSAYAAPLGFIEAGARDYAGEIPLILKINNSDSLFSHPEGPISAVTSHIDDALRLGCSAIGFTIYPGSEQRKQMYEEISEASRYAKSVGLPVVIWSYPRGANLSKEGETAIDVVAYAAQIAAQLGANIIKVKTSTSHIEQKEAKKAYMDNGVGVDSLEKRTRHILDAAFGGRRIVIFSGGPSKKDTEIFDEIRNLARGGSFGSIIGRNAFQRKRSEAIQLLHRVMDIYKGDF